MHREQCRLKAEPGQHEDQGHRSAGCRLNRDAQAVDVGPAERSVEMGDAKKEQDRAEEAGNEIAQPRLQRRCLATEHRQSDRSDGDHLGRDIDVEQISRQVDSVHAAEQDQPKGPEILGLVAALGVHRTGAGGGQSHGAADEGRHREHGYTESVDVEVNAKGRTPAADWDPDHAAIEHLHAKRQSRHGRAKHSAKADRHGEPRDDEGCDAGS